MHDVGSIFLLSECGLIVVDINWLTHTFLGKLISKGHNFEMKEPSSYSSEDCFVSKVILDGALEELSQNGHRKHVTVETQVLRNLCLNLDLCYYAGTHKGIERYFMPTIFGRIDNRQVATSGQHLSWKTNEHFSDWKHFGYRLLCQNRDTTSLASAIFPRFQIHLRTELLRENSDVAYVCERDLIRLDWNGCYVIVENDSVTGDHVDILVRYSTFKREKAVSLVKEHVLEKFRKFCASPAGCRGVSLGVAIIRPECVEKLTPHKYRGDKQVVLVEQLKANLEKDVIKNLLRMKFNEQERSDLLDYEHMWPEVQEAGLVKEAELAVRLLEGEDVEKILKTIEEEQNRAIRNLKVLSKELDESSDGSTSAKETVEQYNQDDRSVAFTDLDLRETKLVNEIMSHLYRELDRVHKRFDQVQDSLQGIRRELTNVLRLQRDQHTTLLSIMCKVDNMLGYTDALEKAGVPRRPFLTVNDLGYREKFVGLVQIGDSVRLHLMCESRLESHAVEDQPGLKLVLAHENKEWLRWISVNSLKVMWYLAKAGVQVMTGLDLLIPDPDFSSSDLVQSGLLITDMTLHRLKDSVEPVDWKGGVEMRTKAWLLLKNYLLPDLNIAETFKLHRVKYNPGTVAAKESYAWLCSKCIDKGGKQLTVL